MRVGQGQLCMENDYDMALQVSAQFRDTVIRPILKAHFRMNEFIGRINEACCLHLIPLYVVFS
jgi:hypothetical protein